MKKTKLHFAIDEQQRIVIATSEGYEIEGLYIPPLNEDNEWGKVVVVKFDCLVFEKPCRVTMSIQENIDYLLKLKAESEKRKSVVIAASDLTIVCSRSDRNKE